MEQQDKFTPEQDGSKRRPVVAEPPARIYIDRGERMNSGENIREMRKKRGMTQKELAAAIGMSKPTVMRYEKGQSYPSIKVMAKIEEILGFKRQSTETFTEEQLDVINRIASNAAQAVLAEYAAKQHGLDIVIKRILKESYESAIGPAES